MKGEKIDNLDRRSSSGNMMRKKFSDITNSLRQPKPPAISEKSLLDSASVKEYIDHLVTEKMVLAKIVQEKNKVLELSGIEIQKIRTSLLMMRLHNWNLARSNSQMLTELSLGREKLKALQHDLVCGEALLKTKNLELKESEMLGREYEFTRDSRSYSANRSRSSKIRSLGSSSSSQPHAGEQAVGRRFSRRRSASSKIQHQEPTDYFYDIDYNTTFPIAIQSNCPNHERSPSSSIKKPFNTQSSRKFNLTRKDQLISR